MWAKAGPGGPVGTVGTVGVDNLGSIGQPKNSGTIDGSEFAIISTGSIGPIPNTGQIIGNVEINNQASVSITAGLGKTFGSLEGGTITISDGDLVFAPTLSLPTMLWFATGSAWRPTMAR